MPYNQLTHTLTREPMYNILMPYSRFERLQSLFWKVAEFPAPPTDKAEKEIKPGLVVARVGDEYVPYSVTAATGTGSDTAVGLNNQWYDVALGTEQTSPLYKGTFIEAYCYIVPSIWVAATAYALNDVVIEIADDGTTPAVQYRCTTAGTSDAAEPTWDTDLGDTTADNTAVWTAEAYGTRGNLPAAVKADLTRADWR